MRVDRGAGHRSPRAAVWQPRGHKGLVSRGRVLAHGERQGRPTSPPGTGGWHGLGGSDARRWLALPLLVPVLVLGLSWMVRVDATPVPPPAVEWVVQPGDTLWDIARAYTPPGEDIRAILWEIRQLNGLDSSEIRPGQVIRIPGHLAGGEGGRSYGPSDARRELALWPRP